MHYTPARAERIAAMTSIERATAMAFTIERLAMDQNKPGRVWQWAWAAKALPD
ncbi:MAG TPA: hypothetical protein VH519_15960 [Hyphomicrobiaceae bacterium]|jgi:hypothetical protein